MRLEKAERVPIKSKSEKEEQTAVSVNCEDVDQHSKNQSEGSPA